MEVLFILGIVAVILMQFVSKAFNSATKANSTVPPVNKPIIIQEKENSPFLDSKNEGDYLDIPKKENKIKKNRSEVNSLNTSSIKDNSPIKEDEKTKRTISLNNISEAKRAFIYSEIFNRKY